LGSLVAGVADFEQGTGVDTGEPTFFLVIANTMSNTPADVDITWLLDGATDGDTRRITACGADAIELVCGVTAVSVRVRASNRSASTTLTINPDQCVDRIVWINSVITTVGNNTTTRLEVSETQPPLDNCPLLEELINSLAL
jgi:hypothetical protein